MLRRLILLIALPATALAQRLEPNAIRTRLSHAKADSGGSWFEGRRGAQFAARAGLAVIGASVGAVAVVGKGEEDLGTGIVLALFGTVVGAPVFAALPRLGSKCSTESRYFRALFGSILGAFAGIMTIDWAEQQGTAAAVLVPAAVFGMTTSFMIQRCKPRS